MDWHTALGLDVSATLQNARRQYLAMARRHHPNKGGNTAAFQQLQRAWDAAQAHFARSNATPTKGSPARPPARSPQRPSGGATRGAAPSIFSFLRDALRLGGNPLNSLHNVNRAALTTAFGAWADAARLSPQARTALLAAITVKSKEDLTRHLETIIERLREHILPDVRFAMLCDITVVGAGGGNTPFRAGISTRLSASVLQALDRQPDAIIPVFNGSVVHTEAVRSALKAGIRDFVYVKDAMFTGLENAAIIRQLARAVDLFAETNYVPGGVHLVTGILFTTDLANKRAVHGARLDLTGMAIADQYWKEYKKLYRGLMLTLYWGEKIAPVPLSYRVRLETWRRLAKANRRRGPTMTILPHRTPNRWAFGASLAASLGKAMAHTTWNAPSNGGSLPI